MPVDDRTQEECRKQTHIYKKWVRFVGGNEYSLFCFSITLCTPIAIEVIKLQDTACPVQLYNVWDIRSSAPKTSVCDIQGYAVVSLLDTYFRNRNAPM